MTKTTKTATKTSELATADNAAITVQAIQPAPIAVDASAKWEAFTARPGVAATGKALTTVKGSLIEIWEYERETQTGKRFAEFCLDASKRIALPLLNLGWLAVNHGYQVARNPETRALAVARWRSVKAWVSPKIVYERGDSSLNS